MTWPRLVVWSLALAAYAATAPQSGGWHEGFEDGWMERWETRRLATRPTDFLASVYGGEPVLRVEADRSAGALIRPVSNIEGPARVSWKWLVDRPIPGEDLPTVSERERAGDDYVARVFVIFGTDLTDSGTRALCYVWARHEPTGAVYPSPVGDRVQTIVLRTGADAAGIWQTESVDPTADYRRIFETEPPPVGAIGIMSDSDDTATRVSVLFDDVTVAAAGSR